MRTSPLENLLIEHPSMSVYHIHQRRHLTVQGRMSSTASQCSDEQEEFEEIVVEDRPESPTVVVRRASHVNGLQTLEQQQKQIRLSRKAQKVI